MRHRTIRIDDQPEAVRRFFEQVGDQPTIVELAGKPVCILYPSYELLYTPEGTLVDPVGTWHLPPEVMRALCREDV